MVNIKPNKVLLKRIDKHFNQEDLLRKTLVRNLRKIKGTIKYKEPIMYVYVDGNDDDLIYAVNKDGVKTPGGRIEFYSWDNLRINELATIYEQVCRR